MELEIIRELLEKGTHTISDVKIKWPRIKVVIESKTDISVMAYDRHYINEENFMEDAARVGSMAFDFWTKEGGKKGQ